MAICCNVLLHTSAVQMCYRVAYFPRIGSFNRLDFQTINNSKTYKQILYINNCQFVSEPIYR